MARQAKRPNFRNTKNVRARITIEPKSLAEFNRKLERLAKAVREEVVTLALAAGGAVIESAAEQRAPGPHIGVEVMKGSELMKGWRSGAAQGIKPNALYVAIGPDKEHWYYRFHEYGVKAHSVTKRKRTRKEIDARIAQGREARSRLKRQFAGKRPAMVFSIDGKLIFARKVKGYAAKPFLRPAADSQGPAAMQAIGAVLKREIEKAARG